MLEPVSRWQLFERTANRANDPGQVVVDLGVGEAKDAVACCFEVPVALAIARSLLRMVRTVDLDDEPRAAADEIQHDLPKRMLSAETR